MKISGDTYKGLGKMIFIVGLLGLLVLKVSSGDLGELTWVFILGMPILLSIGASILFRGKQIKTKEISTHAFDDGSDKVLYLRPFSSDISSSEFVESAKLAKGMMILTGLSTIEEQLSEAVKPFGKLIAIGKPGESLPTPGAARQYISDDGWQQKVSGFMKISKLVIIHAGTGKGLMWEIQRALEIVDQKKLVILIDMKRHQYEEFKTEFETNSNIKLPAASTLKGISKVGGFILFKDGKSLYRPLKAPFLRVSGYNSYINLSRFALKPVFEENNTVWVKPSISIPKIISVLVLGFFVFGFAFIFLRHYIVSKNRDQETSVATKISHHPPMPDQIKAEKTSNHINIRGTKFFIIPPEGSQRSKGSTYRYTYNGKDHTGFDVSLGWKGVDTLNSVEKMQNKLLRNGDEVSVIKNITYNGMPGLYYEAKSLGNYYNAEIRIPMKDSTTMSIKGAYSYETDSVTERRIFEAMRSVYYDNNFKIDERRAVDYLLNDSNSIFKYAMSDGSFFWYTLKGKDPEKIGDEPYFLLFVPLRLSLSNDLKFHSYKNELQKEDWGYIFKGKETYKSLMLANRNAHEYIIPAVDIDGYDYTLFFTEVQYGSETLVMLGVAAPYQVKAIKEFRKLAATLEIVED